MRILRKKRASELAAMVLASTFAVTTPACLQGQSLVNAPLPSYYAGHTASMHIGEPTRPHAGVTAQTKPVQATTVAASQPSVVLTPASDSPVALAQHGNAWLPRHGYDASPQQPQETKQSTQASLPANRSVAPAASEVVRSESGIVVVGEGRDEKGGDEKGKSDAKRRATLGQDSTSKLPAAKPPSALADSQVYDGLPIEGRFERRPAPGVSLAPQADGKAATLATEEGTKKETTDGEEKAEGKADKEGEDADNSQHAQVNKHANEEKEKEKENCDEEDQDDKIEEHFEAVERALDSKVVRNMLGLIKENYKLKAQLRIQEVAFEAQRRIEAAQHERSAAQRRIHELEKGDTDCLRELHEQHTARMRLEAQANEVTQQKQILQLELVKSAQELNELRTVNQQLGRQVEKVQAAHEQRLQEILRKLDESKKSKAELEHRARALEAQLEELRGKLESPRHEDKKKDKDK